MKKNTRSRRGRPEGAGIKLTEAVQAVIVDAIRCGNYLETAAACAGIHKQTFYDWLRKGASAQEPNIYSNFSDAVTRAMAWLLERRFPRRWGRKEYLESTVTEKPVDEMSEAEIDTELCEILERCNKS